MRYFLTGASGFIGRSVAQQLRAQGHEVDAVIRNPAGAKALAEMGVRLHPGDITDKASLRTPMTGADGVFHIAGWYKIGVNDPATATAVNVTGTRNVLEMMRELAIPKGVYTSTVAVYSNTHGREVDESYHYEGPWLSVYEKTKWRAHYEVAEPMIQAGLPLVMVQPALVYGPGDHSTFHLALAAYLQDRLPGLPEGTAYNWSHVDDIARGHILAMEKGRIGESYIISGRAHSLPEAFDMVAELTSRQPVRHIPLGLAKLMLAAATAIEKVRPLPRGYTAENLRMSTGVTYLSSSAKAERELGWTARPLAEGLPETIAHEMSVLGLNSN